MPSKQQTPSSVARSKAFVTPFADGVAKRSAKTPSGPMAPKKPASQWAALAEDDSSPSPSPQRTFPEQFADMIAAVPILAAMQRGDLLWGDICLDDPPARTARRLDFTPVKKAVDEDAEARLVFTERQEAELWNQPFVANLEMCGPDRYITETMSDADFHAFMAWISRNGWAMPLVHRAGVHAYPDSDGAAQTWNRLSLIQKVESHSHTGGCCASAPKDTGKRAGPPVPRFCKDATACTKDGCRYVHGDTIPRLNPDAPKPGGKRFQHPDGSRDVERVGFCQFGATCGASDPAKRALCIYMHPGEVWSEDLVVRRPCCSS